MSILTHYQIEEYSAEAAGELVLELQEASRLLMELEKFAIAELLVRAADTINDLRKRTGSELN